MALALLTGAVVALAGLYGDAARSNDAARSGTMASLLAARKLEQLRGLAWCFLEDGSDLTDTATDLAVQPEAGAGGTGLLPSPPDSLRANTPGFVDHLDASGEWVGTGTTPPARAAYTRRWSIGRSPAGAGDALVLRVVVLRRGTEPGSDPGVGTRFETVVLSTLLARRAP